MATLNPSARASTSPRSMHSRARSRVSAISGDLHPDLSALDRHGITGDARAARGHHTLARPHVVHPAVPGTGEPSTREPSLAEGTALVCTLVTARQDHVMAPTEHNSRASRIVQAHMA